MELDGDRSGGEAPRWSKRTTDPATWSDFEWTVFYQEYMRHRADLRSARSEAESPRQLAAAALDRVVACHDAVWEMQRGRFGFLSGLLVRHAFECWVMGLYLCLSGDEALRHLLEADARALRALAQERPDAGWAEAAGEHGDTPSRRLNLEAVAREVGQELRRRNLPPLDPLLDYQAMYRAESRSSAHAGTASLVRHLEGDDRELWLRTAPVTGLEDGVAQTLVLLYGAHLGGFVFETFEIPRQVMDNVMLRCVQLLEASSEPELD